MYGNFLHALQCVWVRCFVKPDLFDKQCTVQQYHSDLSGQSALEIRVRLKVALF